MSASAMPALHARSSVCALVPHFRCEQWLSQALESLLGQTRPPERIVVIDDASPEPPRDIVAAYPEVTLLAASDNGGPYRLTQRVIDGTSFDAYLFQDADDWSSPERLEALLEEAARTGAELVGSHEVRVLVDQGDILAVRYPLDVNAVLDGQPTSFPLLHPTSLVSAALVRRLGGFATGMRFSGDAEFLRRAGHVARVVNADAFLYFRRKRQGSLTLGSDTALGSPVRQAVQDALAAIATANAALARRGATPDLTPWRTRPAPHLRHLSGPAPDAPVRRAPTARRRRRPAGHRGPVFVVGAARCGHTVLGWALGQHASFELVLDARWLARAASDVESRAAEGAAPPPERFRPALSAALADVAGASHGRPVAAGTELLPAVHALASLFPTARFLHVVRDAEDCVAALAVSPTESGTYYTPEAAWLHWVSAARAGLDMEVALGCETVRRVRYRDLVRDPARAVRACLAFLGEEDHPACLRPLTSLAHAVRQPVPASVPAALVDEARRLSRRLAGTQAAGDPDTAARRRLAERLQRQASRRGGGSLVERVRDLVVGAVPDGATAAVVSKGDPRLVDFPGRTGWHIPQLEGGVYAGHHPADSETALLELQKLARAGAEYLVVPSPALWWLSYYEGLRRHLEDGAALVAFHEEVGAVFRLTTTGLARAAPMSAAASSAATPTPALAMARFR